jgi:aminopeptidase N
MVMEELFGTQKIRHILKQELNAYLEGRSQAKEEQPLISSDTSYVYYRKGAMAIYALKDYIGEEALNKALAGYLQQHSKYSQNVPPYPTVVDLVSYLREATPPHLQYLITDLFETITLYNNRALSATTTKRPDGKYEVKLTVAAQKLRSDEKGNTKVIPMDEMIDIGVLDKNGEIIYRQKHRLESGENTITVVVDKEPDSAGVDPLNMLVNRVLGINLIKVNQQ